MQIALLTLVVVRTASPALAHPGNSGSRWLPLLPDEL